MPFVGAWRRPRPSTSRKMRWLRGAVSGSFGRRNCGRVPGAGVSGVRPVAEKCSIFWRTLSSSTMKSSCFRSVTGLPSRSSTRTSIGTIVMPVLIAGTCGFSGTGVCPAGPAAAAIATMKTMNARRTSDVWRMLSVSLYFRSLTTVLPSRSPFGSYTTALT